MLALAGVCGALTMTNRWWIYQQERFPLAGHGPLILAFSASAVSQRTAKYGLDLVVAASEHLRAI